MVETVYQNLMSLGECLLEAISYWEETWLSLGIGQEYDRSSD
jgi:hypothetical protein